jgi:hypothetical protein
MSRLDLNGLAAKSNDIDFVPAAVIKPAPKSEPLPDEIQELLNNQPKFEPLELEDKLGKPNLPEEFFSTKKTSEIDFFLQLFSIEIIDLIVSCTNSNAERYLQKHQPVYLIRAWKPVSRQEIMRFIGINIYMGIYICPHIHMYWNTDSRKGALHPSVNKAMSKDRWYHVNRFLHIFDEESHYQELSQNSSSRPQNLKSRKPKPCDKMMKLADSLRKNFRSYWSTGTNLSIDEAIVKFTGRSGDTVNIPSKPTPIGFKQWVLVDKGYVYNFLFHVRGQKPLDGPQDIQKQWLDDRFTKTQASVLELVYRMPEYGSGNCVWLDNLFTSEKLLLRLRDWGVGGAGTVRNCATKRDKIEGADGILVGGPPAS